MNNAQKLAALTKPKNVREIEKGILGSFVDKKQDGIVQKTSFSPSRLAWGSGACARYNWFLFNGVEQHDVITAFAQANMKNGTDSHERMQAAILAGPLDAECEVQLRNDDPPINSFCDVLVKHEGKNVPIEIKTCNQVAFEYRQTSLKAAEYHVFQLLIYMKLLDAELGFIMYENKNTYEKLMIPVHMDDASKKRIDDAFNWMREVYSAYQDEKMPKYFKGRRKNSKICGMCPVKEHCDSVGEGTIDIPLLTKYGDASA